MTILITGFEPFGGESLNPAHEAVNRLKDKLEYHDVVKRTLPVVFHVALEALDAHIKSVSPDIIICVGQAGGRAGISIERVGINIDDARIPDNQNQAPVDQPINPNGPAAYFSNLPIKAITAAITEAGIPASVSNTAGTYVCNHVLYGLMDLIHQKYPHVKGGFIHVPFLPSQAVKSPNAPSMHLDDIIKALEIAALTSCEIDGDIVESAGTIC
ncbi:MAG TPA: pyroglutamyl-peptidase I [Clostridiales bacterium UBA8960]|nr:pyroglutamyl-peptidase I [Clostridiales bacterium UBA8960]